MYVPPAFAPLDREESLSAIERYPFGSLVGTGAGGPAATHLPFLLDREAGALIGHLARANPQWQALADGGRVLVIFTGPDGYVSPTWYDRDPSVPTWNYLAVHVWGCPQVHTDPGFLLPLLERTVETFERCDGEGSWRLDASSEYVRDLARGVVGFTIPIDRVEGMLKLSQNVDADLQRRVVAGLRHRAQGADVVLAEEMERARKRRPPHPG